MNSLGNTVLRKGKRSGASGGEQGEEKEDVYSEQGQGSDGASFGRT
jgi:hypothetical protein